MRGPVEEERERGMKFERRRRKERAFFGPPSPLSLPFCPFLPPSPGLLFLEFIRERRGWNILSHVFIPLSLPPFLHF
jgi:hypothetical protein